MFGALREECLVTAICWGTGYVCKSASIDEPTLSHYIPEGSRAERRLDVFGLGNHARLTSVEVKLLGVGEYQGCRKRQHPITIRPLSVVDLVWRAIRARDVNEPAPFTPNPKGGDTAGQIGCRVGGCQPKSRAKALFTKYQIWVKRDLSLVLAYGVYYWTK